MKTIHFVSELELNIKVSLSSVLPISSMVRSASQHACVHLSLKKKSYHERWVPLLADPVHGGSSRHV
jgi:hypothetical protein